MSDTMKIVAVIALVDARRELTESLRRKIYSMANSRISLRGHSLEWFKKRVEMPRTDSYELQKFTL